MNAYDLCLYPYGHHNKCYSYVDVRTQMQGGGGGGGGEFNGDLEPLHAMGDSMFNRLRDHTVKPRPEVHMDMILFEVFLKSIDLIPQQQILQGHYLYHR